MPKFVCQRKPLLFFGVFFAHLDDPSLSPLTVPRTILTEILLRYDLNLYTEFLEYQLDVNFWIECAAIVTIVFCER